MADVHLTRTPSGLVPSDLAAAEWLQRVAIGKPINATVRQPRNAKFHRKFFAMLDVAFSNHEWPEVQTKWGRVRTSKDYFRDYVICKAGHWEADMMPNGEVRAKPKSIAWVNMDEPRFSQLYSDVLDVILAEFLTGWTSGDVDHAVNQMLGFA